MGKYSGKFDDFWQWACNTSVFVYHHCSTTLILLLYVDDIIVTGSSLSVLQRSIGVLSHQFAMKDLGDLYYFWVFRWHETLRAYF